MKLVNPLVDVRALRTRWSLTLALALGGAFLVVDSFAWSPGAASDIGFAVSLAMLPVGLALLATARRTPQYVSLPARDLRVAAWQAIAMLAITIAGWNVVQSRIWDGGTARWLTFANGLAIAGVALAGLILHELSTERVVHSLEIVEREEQTPATTAVS
jgi:hypothetical protein